MKLFLIFYLTFSSFIISSLAAIKLNVPDFPAFGDVNNFKFTTVNNQEFVTMTADLVDTDVYELFTIPVTGGSNINFVSLGFGRDVIDFQTTPNGSRIVFLMDQDFNDTFELYSVPTLGGTFLKLHPDFAPNQDVEVGFQITADSQRVVYRANQENINRVELFSANIITGPTSNAKLNVALFPNGNINFFKVSPTTNNQVVYLAQQNTALEIFSVPADNSQPSIKICPNLAPGNFINNFEIAPNGNRVVYMAQQNDPQLEIYSTPINNSVGNVRLCPNLGIGEFIVNYQITPNSSNVVYRARQDGSTQIEIFVASILGNGPILKLCSNLIPGENITDFKISPDSTRVVYRAQIGSAQTELFSFPLQPLEEPIKKLCPNLDAGENVLTYKITPDSQRVVYTANQDGLSAELFISPITNNIPNLKLSPPLNNANQNVTDIIIHPDNSRAFYLASLEVPDKIELFTVSLGGGISRKLSNPAINLGDVQTQDINPNTAFKLSPSGNFLVYTADQDIEEAIEIFSVNLAPPVITSSTNVTTFVGTNFNYTIAASNGPLLAFGASNLPPWATLNDNLITGIPDVVSTNLITLFATNSAGFTSALMRLVVLPANVIDTNLPPLPDTNNGVPSLTGFTGDFDGDGKIDLLAQKKNKVTLVSLASNGVDISKSVALEKGQKVRAANCFLNTNALILQKGTEISVLLLNSNFASLGIRKLGAVSNKKTKIKAAGDLNADNQPDLLTQQGKLIGALLSPTYQFFNLLNLDKKGQKIVGIISANDNTNQFSAILFQKGKQLFSANVPTNLTSLSQPKIAFQLDQRYKIRGAISGSNAITNRLILTQKKNVGLVTYGTKNLEKPVFKTTKKIGKVVGPR